MSDVQKTVTHRNDEAKAQLQNRLKRVEGQVRGVQKMIEENRYCVDVLVQLAAIQAALKKVNMLLLEDHAKHCVTHAVKHGNGDEALSELMNIIARFSK
ncbi:metal-sensitive transcriptional regulator [Shouchella lonarensis]|uniref:DNA-binding transcriptional regulator, FrmR family n=1 Tax=Shouchella lonarensis TaxID=1464122 RepID=A0A1G6IGU4_9BACI|nr:metal-sensing transcriptional repressor [Shouchella lonarensis]SDC05620.1 DNA-binding transcriptional regulator, FrmR family [Shouchella lonarensis]